MADTPSSPSPAGASSQPSSPPPSPAQSSLPSQLSSPSPISAPSHSPALNGNAGFWSGLAATVRRPLRWLGSTLDVEAAAPRRKVRVLFVDVGNASRSPVAQAFATLHGFHAESAGTFPSLRVAPEAVAAMAEVGVDISRFRPKPLDTSRLESFDRIVTFGDPLPGPYRNRHNVEAWNVLDPQGLSISGYCRMRDDVERQVKAMARRLKVRAPDLVALEGG